jgi:signal transduction histidine kinase
MRVNSLSLRLTISSAIVAIILLASAGLLLAGLFQSAVERNFDVRLRAALDTLLANVELGTDGAPGMQSPLADARFSLPLSGWYWQVSPPTDRAIGELASESLLEQRLVPTPEMLASRDQEQIAAFYMVDAENKRLRVIEQKFKLFGGDDEFSFLVAGNFDELKTEIAAFQRTLFFVLGTLGLGLLAAVFLQVYLGLRPLRRMQESLADIRNGTTEKLTGDFPSELQPVADELNLLIQANTEVIERARTQVGNLAHALKTPLSVLTNEARENKGSLAHKVEQQTQIMRDHVTLYLDRARRAASAQTIGANCEVAPVLEGLGRTLMRINQDRGIAVDVSVAENLRFRGERQDLEEMAGNLMDNACKWATAKVKVSAEVSNAKRDDGRLWLVITVEDDGPGLPEHLRAEAVKRGRRLDESKPGSGLGLSIVLETAQMYDGSLELANSIGTGLITKLTLPANSTGK